MGFPNADKPCKAIFWLDSARPHDIILMEKVRKYLPANKPGTLDIEVMSPVEAMRVTCQRAKAGQDTISATGNVLRDYLTDLFPILELGTSAKMLSIVPLLAGGCMFETGAGGSAPKHVEQFTKEAHLRWDSLGEFLALAESLDMLGTKGSLQAQTLAAALHSANAQFLNVKECQVGRKVKKLDNRGSHFYLAMYWANALASQDDNPTLKKVFGDFHAEMVANKDAIVSELNTTHQGDSVDLGGYYKVDEKRAEKAMRPCSIWNALLDKWGSAAAAAAKVSLAKLSRNLKTGTTIQN